MNNEQQIRKATKSNSDNVSKEKIEQESIQASSDSITCLNYHFMIMDHEQRKAKLSVPSQVFENAADMRVNQQRDRYIVVLVQSTYSIKWPKFTTILMRNLKGRQVAAH